MIRPNFERGLKILYNTASGRCFLFFGDEWVEVGNWKDLEKSIHPVLRNPNRSQTK